MDHSFEELYFKQQTENGVISLVPAVHVCSGRRTASLQIITNEQVFLTGDTAPAFVCANSGAAQAGGSFFSPKGVILDASFGDVKAYGRLSFSSLSRIPSDNLSALPLFMGSRRSHISMRHSVNGSITVGGREYVFNDGAGYMGKAKGIAFPDAYVWTQCMDKSSSVVMYAADTSVFGRRYRAVSCTVHHNGIEYLFCPRLGAHPIRVSDKRLSVCQKGFVLSAEFGKVSPLERTVPIYGRMLRKVKHAAACSAVYTLKKGGRIIMELESELATLEYEL